MHFGGPPSTSDAVGKEPLAAMRPPHSIHLLGLVQAAAATAHTAACVCPSSRGCRYLPGRGVGREGSCSLLRPLPSPCGRPPSPCVLTGLPLCARPCLSLLFLTGFPLCGPHFHSVTSLRALAPVRVPCWGTGGYDFNIETWQGRGRG